MRIHGICLVKNEADIIGYSLRENARWCDRIYVYDNGSTDGTMDRVRALAAELPQIVPFGVTEKPFADSLRADVFNAHRGEAEPGDWWCRLDADEIYIDDVQAFLRALRPRWQVAWSIYLQYYPTERDLPQLEPFADQPAYDATLENLPRHYRADYAEPKFFRHRPKLRWTTGSWPDHPGLIAPPRLRHKHFQYRSPAQIERRLETRREAARQGWANFPHIAEKSWREKIESSEKLHYDWLDGHYVIDEAALPAHLEPRWQRAVKWALHRTGLWP